MRLNKRTVKSKETLIKSEIRLRRISGGGICGASPRPHADLFINQRFPKKAKAEFRLRFCRIRI